MPTVRGSDEGSKKRYAGLAGTPDGGEEMVYKGLETVRTDWTPLAQQFQQGLYGRIFRREPYEDYVRDYVARTLRGDWTSCWSTASACAGRSTNTNATCRPTCAPPASPTISISPGPRGAIPQRRLDPLPDDDRRPGADGSAAFAIDYEHYLTKQLEPVADGILPFIGDSFARLTSPQGALF
jgi:DNA polymerase-2